MSLLLRCVFGELIIEVYFLSMTWCSTVNIPLDCVYVFDDEGPFLI